MEKNNNFLYCQQLESELKLQRKMAEQAVAAARNDTVLKKYIKESCIEDADKWSIIKNPKTYEDMGIVIGNGTTLVKALFKEGTEITDHYHRFVEEIKVVDGMVDFNLGDDEIVELTAGGHLTIPAGRMHSTIFKKATTAYVSVPTRYVA